MNEDRTNKYTEHADRVSARTVKLSNNTEKFIINGLNFIEEAITLLYKSSSRNRSKMDTENQAPKIKQGEKNG